ncbi:HD domain-containing protein [Bacteroidia bacterium]|nr:HD domain-containing protein [Bacteroidia bacterium]MDB9881530.1 HD domain-containing protein [Bacteroidia bacterium]MDC1395302.1 HD domain-containing protein [Bacteroidia bacterium]
MNKIELTITHVKQSLVNAEGGHDWWHIERVWKSAKHIAMNETVDMLVVELGALLHDIADSKFNNGNEDIGPKKARVFLESIGMDKQTTDHVILIIENISFKGGKEAQKFKSLELDVVQDADRLDALGAIGIARTFNYGGFKNREIFNPTIPPKLEMTKEEYKNSFAPSINHFYEKLLLLKDLMNTETGRAMAEQRHRYMEAYLAQFYNEWEGRL